MKLTAMFHKNFWRKLGFSRAVYSRVLERGVFYTNIFIQTSSLKILLNRLPTFAMLYQYSKSDIADTLNTFLEAKLST